MIPVLLVQVAAGKSTGTQTNMRALVLSSSAPEFGVIVKQYHICTWTPLEKYRGVSELVQVQVEDRNNNMIHIYTVR